MTAESTIELQKIDCCCNDCKHLVRDVQQYTDTVENDKDSQIFFFRRKKARFIIKARANKDLRKRAAALKLAVAMKHVYFVQRAAINYGTCGKLNKLVTFIPNTFQLDTQYCFEHRKQ